MIPTVTYLMISYETEEVAAGGEHKENKGGKDQGTGTQGKYIVFESVSLLNLQNYTVRKKLMWASFVSAQSHNQRRTASKPEGIGNKHGKYQFTLKKIFFTSFDQNTAKFYVLTMICVFWPEFGLKPCYFA